ncbi:MAG: hypothetical protein KGJ23_07795 [Euryarchaeota archaeon]|nr:hypothetical protein [Euryarchaeota archaeon]MDE1836502.1 hypothetical protein [Euryarchaeota archaeon]MDE1879303.1 hypothetical protein [Euryarchaeota archaeon]MDE2044472.1 hypothetical protein [Thermoplasmata archaeon]
MVDAEPDDSEPPKPDPLANAPKLLPKKVKDQGEIATARWTYLYTTETKLSNEYAEKWGRYVGMVKRLSNAKPGSDADETAAEKAVAEGYLELRALGANIWELHEERMTLQGDR